MTQAHNPPPRTAQAGPGWECAWSEVLAEMEMDVRAVEWLLSAIHSGQEMPQAISIINRRWEPPPDLGPVPAAYRRRLAELMAAQEELMARLQQAAGATRRQAAATHRLRGLESAVPLYVDIAI